MFLGIGSAPVAAGWRVLPGVQLPSSGEREAEHRETQHRLFQALVVGRFGSTSLLCLFILLFSQD